ncbi:MAG: hypothetical protein MI866_05945 [Bacteroidales bacterium]|nr:hypothetical protein [Bacteroidales bacterium]
MTKKVSLQKMLPEIVALSKEQVQLSNIPISVYVQEAGNLHKRAMLDIEELSKLGMDSSLPERLKNLTAALFEAEINWQELQSDRKKALELWKEKSTVFYDFRKELLEHLEFAFRKDDRLLEQIADIEEGNSHADAIEDLGRLAALGTANVELVEAINYDIAKFDIARSMAREMTDLLATANGYLYRDDEHKLIRDKAYTLLKEVVDEIRDYGRFAFRNDRDHVKGYSSKYRRERSRAYRQGQNNE